MVIQNKMLIRSIGCMVLLMAFFPAMSVADWTIEELSANEAMDGYPQVSNGNVVWYGSDGSDGEVYLWNGSQVVQLTDNNITDGYPQISGDNVVWSARDASGDLEIFFWDGFSTTQLTNNIHDDSLPQISGDNIVWQGFDGSDEEIYHWDGSQITQVTDNSYDDRTPYISGSNVIWQSQNEIFFWSGSQITQLSSSSDSFNCTSPRISGSNAIWLGVGSFSQGDGDIEIFFWNGSNVTRLTDNDVHDRYAQINGGNVVWARFDGNDYEICFWDGSDIIQLTDNNTNDRNPQVSDGLVVWEGLDVYDWDVFVWDGAEIIQLTDDPYNMNDNMFPQVDGNTIVWQGAKDSSFLMDIYQAVYNSTVPVQYSMGVNSSGATGVSISSSTGHGGSTNYTKTINNGTTVTLTAPATSGGKTFTGWSGSVNSSSRTISLSMNANKTVTANYETVTTTYSLGVYSSGVTGVSIGSSTGHGGVTNYSKTINDGTTVTLTAPATSGSKTFTGWSGSVNSSSRTISFSMNANKSVTANYETVTTTYSLNVYSEGATSVTVSSNTGQGGTTDYIRTVNEGSTVTLTASAVSGKTFTGWTGSVNSSSQTISFSMNANKYVTANYQTVSTGTTLSVSSSGATGVVISSSTGHGGTTNYSKSANDGAIVNLSAPATAGGVDFTGWSGSVSSNVNSIWLVMDGSMSVTANYGDGGSNPTLTSISISGSTQVDESSGAQYTCTAHYSDGSNANVTGSADWSENSPYASISSGGYLTTSSVSSDKSCTITATYGGKSDTHNVTIKNGVSAPTTYTLSVSVQGQGSVSRNPSASVYEDGTSVQLTATAASGWHFVRWEGGLTGSNNPATILMNANKSVTAVFEEDIVGTVPAAPSALSATAVNTTRINLSWADNADNETEFIIERSTRNARSFKQIVTVGQNVTTYSDTTVRKGTTYYYRVRASNNVGDSAYSNQANATTPRK